ncbi:C25 family cysteine peptidase [Fibrobacterota bacterium]
MKPNNNNQEKISFILCTIIFLFSSFVQGAAITFSVGSDEKSSAFTIGTKPLLAETGAKGYVLFSSREQLQELCEPGQPNIPWKIYDILLPPDADMSSVSCTMESVKFESAGFLEIKPVLPLATWDQKLNKEVIVWPETRSISNGYDASIYSSNAYWPGEIVRVVQTGKLRSFKIARVAIALAQYNPVKKQLLLLTDITISVTFNRDIKYQPIESSKPDYTGLARVKKIAVNANQYVPAYLPDLSLYLPEPKGYVILTTSAIKDASTQLDNFINHKSARGFNVEVITDWGGGTGNSASENIRKWLQNNYRAKDILYVLLIGNPHPQNGDVPMKFCHERPDPDELHEAPTDMYYSNLSGDWDINNDGYYGTSDDIRTGGVDLHWEVMVGRIPQYSSGDITETDVILQRTVTYENEPDREWRKNALLPWVPMDDQTPNYHCPEQVKDNLLIPKGIGFHRIYESRYNLNPEPEDYPNSYSITTQVWKDGRFGFVFWGTHGWSSGGSDVMNTTNARTLDDDYPTNTWQYSCSTGYPENDDNVSYELLKAACVSTSGATRSGWYSPGQTNYTNSTSEPGMGYQYTKRVVEPGTSIGWAWHDARQSMTPGMWDNFILHNIYGDPSIVIYDTASTVISDQQKNTSSSLQLRYTGSNLFYHIPFLNNTDPVSVTIKLYNMQGKVLRTLVNGRKAPGSYFIQFNNKQSFSAGLYLCKMEVNESIKTIKIVNRL